LHYAKDKERIKFRQIYTGKDSGEEGAKQYVWVETPDGKSYRKLTDEELSKSLAIPEGYRVFRPGPLTSPGASINTRNEITLQGKSFFPGANRHWSLGPDDTEELDRKGRVMIIGNTPCSSFISRFSSFPIEEYLGLIPAEVDFLKNRYTLFRQIPLS
jgi:adenine-specific DNA-methyltransferase